LEVFSECTRSVYSSKTDVYSKGGSASSASVIARQAQSALALLPIFYIIGSFVCKRRRHLQAKLMFIQTVMLAKQGLRQQI